MNFDQRGSSSVELLVTFLIAAVDPFQISVLFSITCSKLTIKTLEQSVKYVHQNDAIGVDGIIGIWCLYC